MFRSDTCKPTAFLVVSQLGELASFVGRFSILAETAKSLKPKLKQPARESHKRLTAKDRLLDQMHLRGTTQTHHT